MIIDEKDVIKEIDDKFWKYITEQTFFKDVINFKDVDRQYFLQCLVEKVNNYEHNFSVLYYNYLPKHKGILRKVKSYSLADNLIYYYCVKKMQQELTQKINKNKNIFGGFKFTPDNRNNEDEWIDIPIPLNYGNSFSKTRFRINWSEYHKLAEQAKNKNYDKYVYIDVSHFYDDINLDILEREIRNIVKDKSNIIDLLFYFLRYSDKSDLGYFPSNVGIPQEDVGEMSRVLANFYLADFDTNILSFLNYYFNEDFIYMRYSDDMWFCFNGDNNDAYNVIQRSSIELEKLKLHINEKKLKVYNANEFKKHWFFDEMELVKNNKYDFDFLKKMLNEVVNNKTGRWVTVATYIIKVMTSQASDYKKLSFAEAYRLISVIIDNPEFTQKMENISVLFFKNLLKKYKKLFFYVTGYLLSKRNVYPTVEYFFINVLIKLSNLQYVTKFILDYYINKLNKDDYRWYTRCLCLVFFMNEDKSLYFEKQRIRDAIIKKIKKNNLKITVIERRYLIYYFCMYLRDDDVVKQYFLEQGDYGFFNHIKGDLSC